MKGFTIETETEYLPEAGRFLIAEPFLQDPEFSRAVVYICNHDADGTFGLIINHPNPENLAEVCPELTTNPFPVYNGGPLENETIMILHKYPELVGGHLIGDGIYIGADFKKLKAAIKKNKIDPFRIKFVMGYSSWQSGQLISELKEKAWLVAPAYDSIVFSHAYQDIYKNSLQPLGKKFSSIALLPKHPTLN